MGPRGIVELNQPRRRKTLGSGIGRDGKLCRFLGKQLRLKPDQRLFCYCDSAFTPSPAEPLDHLFRCFGQREELIVNYATTGAYG